MDAKILTQKYVDEDPNWSIPILIKWLIEKKGISYEIAENCLAEVLLEINGGRDIPKHHEFDNYVFKKCRECQTAIHELTAQNLQKKLDKMASKLTSGNRFSKAWRALIGKL